MPQDHVHKFEEIPVVMPNGQKLYVTGEFNISYRMVRRDPDVGEGHGFYPEFDPVDDWVTVTAFDDDALGEDDMTITLPWLPGRYPGNCDVLGQIWHRQHIAIACEIMEKEDDE